MAEKVKVSREIGKALESAFEIYKLNPNPNNAILEHTVSGSWAEGRTVLHKLELIKLAEILINGYEIEKTPEEKLADLYEFTWSEFNRITDFQNRHGGGYENGFAKGIEKAIEILGIKIKGINE